jgi:Ca-activated chloride channel family protein
MHQSEALKLAIKYQLVSSYTNYIVVAERSDLEKTLELPALRKVPQMLAAGWGGAGTVLSESKMLYDRPSVARKLKHIHEYPQPMFLPKIQKSVSEQRQQTPFETDFDVPLFLRRKESVSEQRQPTPFEFARRCNSLHANWISPVLQLKNFKDLLNCRLPERVLEMIKTIARHYDPLTPEDLIVLAFLMALVESPIGGEFDRNTKRVVQKACKTLRPDDGLIQVMAEAFADIKTDDWGPRFPQY